MAKIHKFRVSSTRNQDLVCRAVAEALAKGVMLRTAEFYTGRKVSVRGRSLFNFGCCSYLGLEHRPELREGAIAATNQYGTQFSVSRIYLECSLYQQLEGFLQEMTGRHILVAPSTTLAHFAALPVLVQDGDAVMIDQFAHASLHSATELLRDVPVRLVRHGRIEQIDELVGQLSSQYKKIWLVLDGLYSMFGDFAPFGELSGLLERHPQLHLYIDDAHASGWFGLHGRGAALMHFGNHERVVVALSLNKSFACAGGALALPNAQIMQRIRRCGGPMLFSGPIQPPMLGAAVASAKLHLAEDHRGLQAELFRRIDYARRLADNAGLPLFAHHRTPIFFLQCDSVNQATECVRDLEADGFFVCLSAFPAVPVNHPGIRFSVTLHNQPEDIDALIKAVKFRLNLTPEVQSCLPSLDCEQVSGAVGD